MLGRTGLEVSRIGLVAVAWVLRHPAVTVAIVGFRRPEQADQMVSAVLEQRVHRHDEEPGCAIRKAVMAGEVSPNRYQSYMKLKEELR